MASIKFLGSMFVMVVVVGGSLAEMTPVQPTFLTGLTQVGGVSIVSGVQEEQVRLEGATSEMSAKVTYCNGVMETYKQNCINCIKQKCQDKASSCNKELTFSGVINSISDFGSNVISSIKDIGSNVVDTIVDTGKKIISGIKKITGWGRRRRVVRSEPSCSAFNNQESAAQACLYYQDQCSQCSYDPHTHCSGYTAVKNHYDQVVASTAWLNRIGNDKTYQVEALSYDVSTYDPTTQGWRTVSVSVNIFGRRATFYLAQPVNPFDATSAGAIIGRQALTWFKQHA